MPMSQVFPLTAQDQPDTFEEVEAKKQELVVVETDDDTIASHLAAAAG